MTTVVDQEDRTPKIPPEKVNSFERIWGVFANPGETFASIAKRPDVLIPLLILCVISLVGGVLIARAVDFPDLARQTMESNPQVKEMPPERLEKAVSFTATMMKGSAYASPILSIIGLLVVAGVLLIAFRLFAGEGTFKQAFAASTYAWYPRLLKGILATVVLLNRESLSIWELANPIRSNLGFLFDPKVQPLQFALASSVDLFSIWSLVLLIIGFAALSKLSRARSSAIVISLWVVVQLLSLIGPAMQAMRSGS